MKPLIVAVLLVASLSFADAVEISLSNARVQRGKGVPTLKLAIREPIAGFEVKLQRNDGKALDVKGGGKPGMTRAVELDSPVGVFTWKGSLVVNFPNGTTGDAPLELETEVIGPLSMTFNKDTDLDLAHRTLRFTLSNAISKVNLKVLMDTGELAHDGDIAFDGEAGGSPLSVSWPEAPGKLMKLTLTAYDRAGYYVGVEVTAWSIEIPHDDVVFDSGAAAIRADEEPKLQKSAGLIVEAVTKYGRYADVKLFVAGHTDTVGDAAANRALSLKRARAISQYFRKAGLRIPISYEGFGEDAPAVNTADETAEQKNRRAQYFIAIDPPTVLNATRAPTWQRL